MNSAESLGQLIGLGITIFLPLIAIIMNGISIRRRSTNTWGALSIIVTCLGIMLLTFSGLGLQTTHVPFRVVRTLSITGLGLMAVSMIFAIVGIVQCIQHRRYSRGRRRAIIAILLNGFFLTLFVINTVAGVEQTVALRNILNLPLPKGSAITNETWNFKVQPPADWNAINPAAFGPEVQAALGRNKPEMYALISAEPLPEGSESALAGAMDLLKHTLRADGKVEFGTEKEQMEGGFPSRILEMRSQKTTGDFFYIYWFSHRNGTLFRLSIWGAANQESRIREETKKIIDSFELIDPKKADPSASKRTLALAVF